MGFLTRLGLVFLIVSTAFAQTRTSDEEDEEITSTATEVVYVTLEPLPTPQIKNNRTLTVKNECDFPIFPAVLTTEGTKPFTSGFLLDPGKERKLWVSHDWTGRIWGRTNCSWTLDDDKNIVGKCLTGDCGGNLEDCNGGTGEPPATLAEFALLGHANLSYYDVSLVDGYNLDMQIIAERLPKDDSGPEPPAPKCVATLERDTKWCPWDNQYFLEEKEVDRIFFKPNDDKKRLDFNPCLSDCARTGSDRHCCKNKYNDPKKCKPDLYSKRAKSVCGDAYSFAYDDQSSTFTVPSGAGFQVIFCPGGESSSFMKTSDASVSTLLTRSSLLMALLVSWALLFP